MDKKKQKLAEAMTEKTGKKVMKRDRTGQWVVALMFGLLMVGSAPVAVGAEEQAQEQEVEIEEVAEQATVVSADSSDAIMWVANTPEQVATEIDKQSNEKDQDPLSDYTIVWGDTLWAISLATGTTVEELAEINNIENPDLIYAGDLLTLADGTVVSITPEQDQVTQPTQTGTGEDVADNEPVEVMPDQTPENKEDGDTGNFTPVNPEKDADEEDVDDKDVDDEDSNDKDEDDKDVDDKDKDVDDKDVDDKDEDDKDVDEEDVDDKDEDDKDVDDKDEEELEVIEEEVVKPETEVELEETEPEVQEPEDSGEEETPVEEPTETPVEPDEDPNVVDGDKEVTEPKDPEDEESVEISVAERTETSQIKFTEVRRENPDLPLGEERVVQEGSFGTLVKTYQVTFEDGVEVSSELVSEEVTVNPVDKIVEFGTHVEQKPVITTSTRTETENLPFERVTKGNPDMWDGDTEVVQTGSFGKVVREYKVTYSDGVEVSAELVNETRTEPVKEVIHVGTKPEVSTKTRTETEEVSFETDTVENSNLAKGETRVVQEGVNGERTITYEQTFIRGEFDSEKQVSSEITKQPVNKIIEVGTFEEVTPELPEEPQEPGLPEEPVVEVKTVTKTETIEFDVEVIEVIDLDIGEEKVLQEGVNGEQEVVYEQVFEDGKLVKVTELSRTTTRESVTKVVEIGVELTLDIELFGQEMLKEVNKLRASVGVAPLQYDSNLQAGVNIRADEIVDVFTHERPDGSSPFTAFDGINSYRSVGENIARNYDSGTDTGGRTKESVMAEVFVRQYAKSSGHYANMVNERFEYFATGVTVYNRINVTNVQIFGGR